MVYEGWGGVIFGMILIGIGLFAIESFDDAYTYEGEIRMPLQRYSELQKEPGVTSDELEIISTDDDTVTVKYVIATKQSERLENIYGLSGLPRNEVDDSASWVIAANVLPILFFALGILQLFIGLQSTVISNKGGQQDER